VIAEIGTAFSETGIAKERPKAVVLLSGGIDSAVTLAVAQSRGFDCTCLSVKYGQAQVVEVAKATELAADGGVRKARLAGQGVEPSGFVVPLPHVVIEVDGRTFGLELPPVYNPMGIGKSVFLSFATEFAEVAGADRVFVGGNIGPCPRCVENVDAPLVGKSKAEIIHLGLDLGVDMAATHSCTSPRTDADLGQPVACGRCDACIRRAAGFAAVGLGDPALHDGREIVVGVLGPDARLDDDGALTYDRRPDRGL
jgi:7-cyano-7-deazaguanine synthase